MSHGHTRTHTESCWSHGFARFFTFLFYLPVPYDATALRSTRLLSRAVAVLAAGLLMVGCGGSDAPQTEEQKASLVAKECYEGLYINGHPELFLNGRIDAAQMPQSFRQQLLSGYSKHLRQVESQRRGVRSIEVASAQRDSTLNLVQVFLTFHYGNGSQEEIVVPMVQATDGSWHMK